MLHRRIAYGMVLLAAVLFQICFTDYFSWFILILALSFPFLSLAISLPAILFCRLSVAPQSPTAERGSGAVWDLTVTNRAKLPFSRLTFDLRTENQLTGEIRRVRRTLSGASEGKLLRERAETPHCGRLTLSAVRIHVCDLLGLFSVRLPAPGLAVLLTLPEPTDPGLLPEIAGTADAAAPLKPRPGGGPGEDYDLRPYRPGDPLRSVHWKLSSKLDTLVVRETLEPRLSTLVLTYDHFGTPDKLDAVFARLCAISRALLLKERPHYIQWADPVNGSANSFSISSERELLRCLDAALSLRAPAAGLSILDFPTNPGAGGCPVRRFHITPQDPGAEGDMA